MINIPFITRKRHVLGIDIGTSSTRIVELSYAKKGGSVTLKNYGEKVNEISKDDIYGGALKKDFTPAPKEIARDIKEIISTAEMNSKQAAFSIPGFITFFTVFKVPVKQDEDISSVVEMEARQHIPFPIKEVDLDWSVIEESEAKEKAWSKILLVAVPKKTISRYSEIAQRAGLEFLSIEPEVFSLVRAGGVGNNSQKTALLIDIGIQSTTISVVEEGVIKSAHNSDFSEREIVRNLVSKLNVSYNEADEIRRNTGFVRGSREGDIMCDSLENLVNESKQITDNFLRAENRQIEKNILSGGLSRALGFQEFIQKSTGRETSIINPFMNFSYPSDIEETLKEIGSRYAIAAGLALRYRE